MEGECNLGQNALRHIITLIKYHAKPVAYISHFEIMICLLCLTFSSKKCYNHFEIRIYTVFHPKNCKKMLKIIFSGHSKGLSPGFLNFLW